MTQISFESPVEVEEEYTSRENGCAFAPLHAEREEGFQAEQASQAEFPEQSEAPAAQPGFRTRVLEIFWRWGTSPDAEPKGKKPGFAIAQKFETQAKAIEDELGMAAAELRATVQAAREDTLNAMEEKTIRGDSRSGGAALSYFGKTYRAKLRERTPRFRSS